eukprot:832478-Ditylum_brightwellii.AAC.1
MICKEPEKFANKPKEQRKPAKSMDNVSDRLDKQGRSQLEALERETQIGREEQSASMGEVVGKPCDKVREWRLQLDEWGKQIQKPYNEIDPMKIRQKDKKNTVWNESTCTYYAGIPKSKSEPKELKELKHDENAWKAKVDKAEIRCDKMDKKNL